MNSDVEGLSISAPWPGDIADTCDLIKFHDIVRHLISNVVVISRGRNTRYVSLEIAINWSYECHCTVTEGIYCSVMGYTREIRSAGVCGMIAVQHRKEKIMRKILFFILILLAVFLVLEGCATDPYTGEKKASKASIGAMVGAVSGAVVGAATGDDSDERRKRALIGAGVGALAGGGVGYYMDRQEAKLREQLKGTGVSVTRQGDNIMLNMPGNVTFEFDSYNINANFYDVLNSVVLVLKEYEKTLINVYGHTDSIGSDFYNQTLSERRAASVGQYLFSHGILNMRIITQGFGETRPIASNDTEEGRQLNRRVELELVPLTQG